MRKIGKLTGYVPRGGYISAKDVPFKEALPLKLKNAVSAKGGKSANVACIQEMSVLFACLKKHDFKEKPCSAEISVFQKCYTTHIEDTKTKEEQDKQGVLVPGEKRLSHKQANVLLKKFPC